jgi:hypothetical protein
MASSDSCHGMEQSRALDHERNQLLLKWIALAVVRVEEETATERYKVMYIWNRRSIDIRELDDKALAGRTIQRHAAASRCRLERVLRLYIYIYVETASLHWVGDLCFRGRVAVVAAIGTVWL